jgi:cobalt-zinc-cadmium efflux system outer membrane protein
MQAEQRISESERPEHSWRASSLLGALALVGCVAYQPQPLEPLAILRQLEQTVLPVADRGGSPPATAAPLQSGSGLTARQAAGWAVAHNPALVAFRGDLGIAEAELVRAGLLPDPVAGWDAMDVLAVDLTGGTPRTAEHLAGLGVSWQVPRPGEIGARVGAALAREDEVRQGILAAEWRLVREVHVAFTELVAARARLELNSQLLEIARRTATFFKAARAVGGATAIQESLAGIELATLEQERVRLAGDLRTARQALNRLLGLPPATELEPEIPANPFALGETDQEVGGLVEQAVQQRPDLRQLLALYRASEEELRLEIAQQWPSLAIGTGVALVLPIFSRFNRPAIQAAVARRERVGREVRAAVHALRAEVHEAVTALRNAALQVHAFDETLLPRVQESLRLTDEAFRAREVTLVEILTAQKQVLDVRSSYLDARIRVARARILVETVSGNVLADDLGKHKEEKR